MGRVSSFTSQDWLRFQAGDASTFEQLYHEYFEPLYNYGYRFSKDSLLIEDAIHDLFLRLWKNRSNLRQPPDIKNYIFKAFRHQMIDKLSHRTHTTTLDIDDLSFFALEANKETELISREDDEALRRKINDMLGQLTPHQREAVFLRYYENLPYPEIAGILNMSQKATYKLIGRAISSLRKIISPALFIIPLIGGLIC